MGGRYMRKFFVLAFLTAYALAKGSKHKSHVTKFKERHTAAQRDVTLSNGCAETLLGDSSYSDNPTIPSITWLQTPSIYERSQGSYVARGREVHLAYLKEQLKRQKQLVFDATRTEMNLVSQLEIQAGTLYIQGTVSLHGINTLKIYAREIVSSGEGELDVSAPDWNQQYDGRVNTERPGDDGEHGVNGPQVEIHADIVRGALVVIASGGNGHVGQNGGNGAAAANSGNTKPDKPSSACTSQSASACRSVPGDSGVKGPTGGQGANAGNPGNGGNAGNIIFRKERIEGKLQLRSCRGNGAAAATNGAGGRGGAGGHGGLGIACRLQRSPIGNGRCITHLSGQTLPRGDDGPRGDQGNPGTTPNTPGTNGDVTISVIQSGTLDTASKQAYPLSLLKLMRRQAEDLLLSNPEDASGSAALTFIFNVASGKTETPEVTKFIKAVRRKLAFVGKEDFDIFGKIKMFAPRIKYEYLEDVAEGIKADAASYENAYNLIKTGMENNENFEQLAQRMSAVSAAQVGAEKQRLEEARIIAQSEKNLYIKSIKELEERMTSILAQVTTMLPDWYETTKFNKDDFLAVLQGVVGFVQAGANPLELIDTSLGLASDLSASSCLGTLSGNLAIVKKWLTFGAHFVPLENSSDLDFDQLDVASVPEVMQSDLDTNKESLTTQLICMLDVKSRPQDIAPFKQQIEAFFIAGSTRIDLIGKVMDLDNEMGGYNFDIPLLEETQEAITAIGNPQDNPITEGVQLDFLESLLGSYREMERSFMKEVYELHKGFEFRTLWKVNNPLATFQRVAAESAEGTGQLNGIVELTTVLRNFKRIETKAVKCFTNNLYTTDVYGWSFDSTTNSNMFQELWTNGYTRFNINIEESCDDCYNVRSLKTYIELSGDVAQPSNVPGNVHLLIRHLSRSEFQAAGGTPVIFRQPMGSPRKIKFDRFSISDEAKCIEAKQEGNRQSSYCVTKTDSRWFSMCNNPLNEGPTDSLLGEEECKSPFGTYEISIPKDNNLECDAPGIRNKNCKDLDITKFTKMKVWAYFFYWSDNYPTGPDDPICRSPRPLRQS